MTSTIYNTIDFGNTLIELSKKSYKIEIFSAFIKLKALETIASHINKEAKVKIIARWKYEDITSKASDLEVYNFCKYKNWSFGIDLKMHQKIYRFDNDTVLLGSNNLTASGLALQSNYNNEAGVKLKIINQEIFMEYYNQVVWLDDNLFKKLKNEISNFKDKKKKS